MKIREQDTEREREMLGIEKPAKPAAIPPAAMQCFVLCEWETKYNFPPFFKNSQPPP